MVENSTPGHGADKLRKDRLVTGLLLVHRVNLVGRREITDREQECPEDGNDDRECPLRSGHFRFPEKWNTIADRLDTSHRRATAGERTQQNPGTHGFGPVRNWGRRLGRLRISAAQPSPDQADRNHASNARHESDHRKSECHPRFPDAAQIDESQHNEHQQAKRQPVSVQPRNR